MLEASRRELRQLIENKNKIVLAHCSSGYKYVSLSQKDFWASFWFHLCASKRACLGENPLIRTFCRLQTFSQGSASRTSCPGADQGYKGSQRGYSLVAFLAMLWCQSSVVAAILCLAYHYLKTAHGFGRNDFYFWSSVFCISRLTMKECFRSFFNEPAFTELCFLLPRRVVNDALRLSALFSKTKNETEVLVYYCFEISGPLAVVAGESNAGLLQHAHECKCRRPSLFRPNGTKVMTLRAVVCCNLWGIWTRS